MALIHFEGDVEWTKIAIAGHAAELVCLESGGWEDVACGGDDQLQCYGAVPYNAVVGDRRSVVSAAEDMPPPRVGLTATRIGM